MNRNRSALRVTALTLLLVAQISVALGQRRTPAPVIAERNIRAELGFLASDAMQGRGSMTGYERIAAEYIGSQFRQFGLEPGGDEIAKGNRSFVQRVALESMCFSEPPTLTAVSGSDTRKWQFGKDLLVPIARAPHSSGELQVIDVDGPLTKGAAVLIKSSESLDQQKRQELVRRARMVRVAILILAESESNQMMREAGTAKLPTFPSRFKDEPQSNNETFIFVSLRKEAVAELAAMPAGTRIEFGGATQIEEAATWNAIGVLRGSVTGANAEVIILSAHLDHLGVGNAVNGDSIFNGADDDASGCVAVMELARALATARRPRRTIYFVCFGSEERGGFGSRYFIEHSPVPLDRIVADLTFEMLGRPDPKVAPGTLWLTGFERSTLGPELARQGARLVADPHPEQNFFQRSDNYPLALRGIVAHTVSSFGLHADYHRPSDEVSKIDFAFMTQAITSLVAPVRWLAETPFKPVWLPGKSPTRDSE